MGVEPYLVASSLEAVLAQRLTRLICDACKAEDDSAKAAQYKPAMGLDAARPIYLGRGCEACRASGYRGRRGVFEMMAVTEEVRQLLLARVSSGQIRESARAQGMKSMREDGWRLVSDGVTTVEEVLRVTKEERLSGASFDASEALNG